jgi:hypothetical protein
LLDHAHLMREGMARGTPISKVASRALFLTPTYAFEQNRHLGFEITERVADFFRVSVRAVHVCGSGKFGFSPVKNTPFIPTESDLDFAVIDSDCFTRYLDAVIVSTDQYRDLSGFPRINGNPNYASFAKYLAKGMFRPDMMPVCDERRHWNEFFGTLSQDYAGSFLAVSAGLYLSDKAFELKQSAVLRDYVTREFKL